MAIKTFTTGEVLTASDTNTYLANSGLVYVGQTTTGSAVTTITLDNIFTSTYNAYKIVMAGGTSTAVTVCTMQLLNSSGSVVNTEYYETFVYSAYSGSTVLAANSSNVSAWQRFGGAIQSGGTFGTCELINPFNSTTTTYIASPRADQAGGNAGQSTGIQNSTTSCRGIRLVVSSGTVSNCVVTAYGYRLG
jgi:hypothetical protein